MRKTYIGIAMVLVTVGAAVNWRVAQSVHVAPQRTEFQSPPSVLPDDDAVQRDVPTTNWKRPDGPPVVVLQAGHWKANEVPDELAGLKNNGAIGGGKKEWEVNLAIAKKAAVLLRARGVDVEVLPTTVPPNMYADAFVAIHADSSDDRSTIGFKAASPWRDVSGKSESLSRLLNQRYAEATDLPFDPNVTRNMRDYYAFNWQHYEHSLNPMTPAAILETGYLTSAHDRKIIVARQDKAAQGVAKAVADFLTQQGLLTAP